MSLDIYLLGEPVEKTCQCVDCGHTHTCMSQETHFDANITHNLNTMADAAGIYEALWRPNEHGHERAKTLVPLLEAGLERLRSDPNHYRNYDAKNGWGTYEQFVPFVEKVLEACRAFPEARIRVSR